MTPMSDERLALFEKKNSVHSSRMVRPEEVQELIDEIRRLRAEPLRTQVEALREALKKINRIATLSLPNDARLALAIFTAGEALAASPQLPEALVIKESSTTEYRCTICNGLAYWDDRPNENVWRHAGGSTQEGFLAQTFCDRYGYPIKVKLKPVNATDRTVKDSLTVAPESPEAKPVLIERLEAMDGVATEEWEYQYFREDEAEYFGAWVSDMEVVGHAKESAETKGYVLYRRSKQQRRNAQGEWGQ